MAQGFAFTFVRYKILALVILSFVFVIISFSRQDWMREELSMKMGPIKKMAMANFDSILNKTAGMVPASSGIDTKAISNQYMTMVPDDGTINMMIHFGLKMSCIKITAKKLGNPLQLAVPVMTWCFDNDVFTKPEKYNIPNTEYFSYWTDEMQALNHAYICLVFAMLFIMVALLLVVAKAFKWPFKFLVSSSICCLIACICIIAALLVVHSKFDYKEKYDQNKSIYLSMQLHQGGAGGNDMSGSRKRRDDNDPSGYGDQYKKQTGMSPAAMSLMGPLIAGLDMKESIGSPLLFAGVSIGLLLIVVLLSFGEYLLIKKTIDSVESGIKYENVNLA